MRSALYVLSTLIVMGLGYWAYVENYKTQAALDEVETLQRDIGQMRERLVVLKAEWAYLNRPDRLRDLAEMNFDRLGLLPLAPEQFGRVDQIAYPQEADALPLISSEDSVDVQGDLTVPLDGIEDLETQP
ncbi:cell division protein FtsL [Maritimibacter sp. UBA3975]|uniref:cell division protein FtsL n=1 Tax=Maritimibacter sp. UBA3975 TaxID=1946833 RepID=UPI0025C41F26|nr:cell division protein FtsL [Maritimibacter sp. UBA3975]|tara:strand:- start:15881 stop:16270 length:390 start_codon:yes stop_codon:yes gene_type:complete